MQRIGAFYREKVLSQKDLTEREFPYFGDEELRIEQDFFGFNLYVGKQLIECRSEEEARYLKVLIDAGMTEISIPKDDAYLKKILPELENLKERSDDILDHFSIGLRKRSLRYALKRRVYQELIQ